MLSVAIQNMTLAHRQNGLLPYTTPMLRLCLTASQLPKLPPSCMLAWRSSKLARPLELSSDPNRRDVSHIFMRLRSRIYSVSWPSLLCSGDMGQFDSGPHSPTTTNCCRLPVRPDEAREGHTGAARTEWGSRGWGLAFAPQLPPRACSRGCCPLPGCPGRDAFGFAQQGPICIPR